MRDFTEPTDLGGGYAWTARLLAHDYWRMQEFTFDLAISAGQELLVTVQAVVSDQLYGIGNAYEPPSEVVERRVRDDLTAHALGWLAANRGHYRSGFAALDAFVTAHAPDTCATWSCISTPEDGLLPWDSPAHAGVTVVPMHGHHSSYVECYASIRWERATLHLTMQDAKAGVFDDAWDVAIPPEWLALLRSFRWPPPQPERGPWF